MLGKDSKKNIQFPVQKQGTPSVVVLEDFFNEEFIIIYGFLLRLMF